MSTQEAPQVQIHGPITPNQADALRQTTPESAPAQREILQNIGATAGEKSFALVAIPGEDGKEKPSHLVTLDPRDMGTEVLPGKKVATELSLPSPEDAQRLLQTK